MLLAIDSSLNGYSAALEKDGRLVFAFANQGSKSQQLITDLKKAFAENSLDIKDLEYLIVNIGPGSFTGIRTALTIVKTLAANIDLKTIPVNNFQLLRFLNLELQKLAFRASQKNANEFFISLDENYVNLETNFFATELGDSVTLCELPVIEDSAKLLINYVKEKKDIIDTLVTEDIQPYYLREPSLRLSKQYARS